MVGGLRGAALVVQRGAAGGVVLAHGQPGVARDIAGLLARLGDAAAGQVIHVGILQAAALDDFLQGQGQQVRGMKVAQIPHAGLAAGDGGPDCFYDNGFTHG